MHGNLFEREHQGERTLGASQGSLLCPSQYEQTSRQNDVKRHFVKNGIVQNKKLILRRM